MSSKNAAGTGISLFSVVIVFILVFLPFNLTMAPGAGPGSAAGWLLSSVSDSVGENARFSPLFLVFTKIVGNSVDLKQIPEFLNILTYVGYALYSSLFVLIFMHLYKRWNIFASTAVAVFSAFAIAGSRVFWASALLVNPATWALALSAIAAVLVLKTDSEKKLSATRIILSFVFTLLASLTHLGAILLIPAIFILVNNNALKNVKLSIAIGAILVVIPVVLYFLVNSENIFIVRGILNASPGIDPNRGFRLIGWSLLWSVTPAGLLLALWGIYAAISRENMVAAYIVSSIADVAIIGGIVGSELAEFAAIFLSTAIAALMMVGVIDLLSRIKKPVVLIAVFIIPALMIYNGSKISRVDENIWEIHNKNVFRTVRLNSIVLSSDDVILNTLYNYYLNSETMRGDLTVINPKRLHEVNYLEFIDKNYGKRLKECSETFKNLKNASIQGSGIFEAKEAFLLDLIDKYNHKPGVMVTNGFQLPEGDYNLIAEGMFMRVHRDGPTHMYHFAGLNLDGIRLKDDLPMAQQYVISQYVSYFTLRGGYLLKNEFTPEGIEYIRWALKINPNYVPAKIIARQYDISGDPRHLGK